MDSFAEGLCVGLHSMCISPNCRAPNLKNETLNPASFTVLGLGAVEFWQSNLPKFQISAVVSPVKHVKDVSV